MKAFKLSGEAKIRGVIEYIDDLIESNTKFLVFAHHLSVLDALDEHLAPRQANKSEKFDYIRIDGQTKAETRHEYVKKF
jgi:SNF2 family DNA or RNA helicase